MLFLTNRTKVGGTHVYSPSSYLSLRLSNAAVEAIYAPTALLNTVTSAYVSLLNAELGTDPVLRIHSVVQLP